MSTKTATTSFGTDQLNADASNALQSVVTAAGLAPQLVEQWVKLSNGAAVQAVAEQGQGAARKAARRGLNVLKSRGVIIPRTAHIGAVQGKSPTEENAADTREAWLLPPDNAGAVGIVLAERVSSGRYSSVFCYLQGEQNLLRIQSGLVSYSKLKANMARALAGAGYFAVRVPWVWAQQRIATCRQWHADNSVTEPMGFMGAAKLLEQRNAETCSHPFDEEGLELGLEDAQKMAKDSLRLHQLPEFRSWLPGQRALQELLAKVGGRLDPESLSDPEKVQPVMREEVLSATDRYFTPERRQALVANLKDSALSVLARQGEQAALQIAALITVVSEAGLITNPPREITFLTAFFDKGIAILSAQQGGRLRVPVPRAVAAAAAGESEGENESNDEGENPDSAEKEDTEEKPAES